MGSGTRTRITGIGPVDDLIVGAVAIGGQAAVVAIMLPVMVVVMIGSVSLGMFLWFGIAFLPGLVGVNDSLISTLSFLPLVGALVLTVVVSVRLYRHLPRALRRIAFPDEHGDAVGDAGSTATRTSPVAPTSTLAELDARLAPGLPPRDGS